MNKKTKTGNNKQAEKIIAEVSSQDLNKAMKTTLLCSAIDRMLAESDLSITEQVGLLESIKFQKQMRVIRVAEAIDSKQFAKALKKALGKKESHETAKK